jgi:hypothetical protein
MLFKYISGCGIGESIFGEHTESIDAGRIDSLIVKAFLKIVFARPAITVLLA